MSTCAELPQLGCCDDQQAIRFGYYRIALVAVEPPSVVSSLDQLVAVFANMRNLISSLPFPVTDEQGVIGLHIYRYNIAENTATFAPDGVPGDLHAASLFSASGFGQIASAELANLFRANSLFPARWNISVGRQLLYASKLTPEAIGVTITLPACLSQQALSVTTCILPRVTEPVALPNHYGLRDRGNAMEMETIGADESSLTPDEFIASPVGTRALSRVQFWSSASIFGGGFPAPCCDLSPLPP